MGDQVVGRLNRPSSLAHLQPKEAGEVFHRRTQTGVTVQSLHPAYPSSEIKLHVSLFGLSRLSVH